MESLNAFIETQKTLFQSLDLLHKALITITILLCIHILLSRRRSHASPEIPPTRMVDFLLTVGKLKTEKRTGWVNNKIPLAESIADHQYRMAIMGYFIRSPTRDPAVTATVALVHDIAEAIVGDITPPESSGVSVADKHRLEDQAMKTICGQLIGKNGENDIYNDMDQLYSQYNQQTSEEGKFCKQLDKLEMLIQAFEYETQHPEKDLSGFYKSADKGIHDPYLKQIQKEVLIRREVLKGKGLS